MAEKSKHETEVPFSLPLSLLIASITGGLFETVQKELAPLRVYLIEN